MFLAKVINAKVHLFSGLLVGGLVVAAARKMKHGCLCSNYKSNYVQPSENKPSD